MLSRSTRKDTLDAATVTQTTAAVRLPSTVEMKLLLFIYYATGAAHKKTHIKETYTIKAYTIKRKPTNMRLTKP